MAGLQRQACYNHADRYGHAVCMTCKKTVCQECATEFDGVNFCVACLLKRRATSGERSSVLGWILVLGASAALFFAGPAIMVWGTTLLFRGIR